MLVPSFEGDPAARWMSSMGRWMRDDRAGRAHPVEHGVTHDDYGMCTVCRQPAEWSELDQRFIHTAPTPPDIVAAAEYDKIGAAARAAALGLGRFGTAVEGVATAVGKLNSPDRVVIVSQTVSRQMTIQEIADELEVPVTHVSMAVLGTGKLSSFPAADELLENGEWGEVRVASQ